MINHKSKFKSTSRMAGILKMRLHLGLGVEPRGTLEKPKFISPNV